MLRILALLVCLAAPQPVFGATVLYRTDAELIALSERVVHARAVAERVAEVGPEGQRIYTVTTLAVLEDFTGQEGDTLEVWELGGVSGNRFQYVGGGVQYEMGREVFVCLERGPYGLRSVAMGFSKFDAEPMPDGDRLLHRNLRDTVVVGGRARRDRTLREFRQLAAQVTGRRAWRRPALRQEAPTAEAPFTLLAQPGYRWAEADLGIPITWYTNTTAPPPLTTGDAVGEIQTALWAWTNPPSASIVLQYGGTTLQPNIKGPWHGLPNASGVITFEDPNNELGYSILAIGGGGGNTGTGGTLEGVQFNGFSHAYVIFQKAANLPVSFRASLDFARVMTHEIGHGIGLGHTQPDGSVPQPTSNIMYATCCHPQTPVPPALGQDDLAGVTYLYPLNPINAPTMALDRTVLNFGAVSSGTSLVAHTSAQPVHLTQVGAPGTVTWTAMPDVPWLQVTPSSGSGPAMLSITIIDSGALPASGTLTGRIQVMLSGSWNVVPPVSATLRIVLHGSSGHPFGAIDTPLNNSTGVAGAVPFTGWALDDIEVDSVAVCRAAVAAEGASVDARCGGAAQIYVGDAVFSEGARPDVQAGYSIYPRSTRAGWGLMVLTNMLPDVARGFPTGGNGTFVFHIYARDREGQTTPLGTRSLVADNANATKPFGTIDTPGQGAMISGSKYVNFGWALTQQPKFIPPDGSTITVFVDGVPVGNVSYNHFRADIASLFPGLANSNGAVGFRVLDTTTLTDGVHTIAWSVTDSAGAAEGIGSRYFTVANGPFRIGSLSEPELQSAAAAPAASGFSRTENVASGFRRTEDIRTEDVVSGLSRTEDVRTEDVVSGLSRTEDVRTEDVVSGFSRTSEAMSGFDRTLAASSGPAEAGHYSDLDVLPLDQTSVRGRRGWDVHTPLREYPVAGSGRVVVRGEELDRFELHLSDARGHYTGYLRVGRELAALPIGSRLNAESGVFTWQPGVGFIGAYDLVFVRSRGGQAVARQEVRIILQPKRSGHVGPQVVIDTPRALQDVGQPFMLAGWAADLGAEDGPDIDTLHVWAYPLSGAHPIFLGVAAQGGARPDVAAVHGDQFRDSGYGLVVQGLPHGNYDLAVFAYSTRRGGFAPATTVRVTVR